MESVLDIVTLPSWTPFAAVAVSGLAGATYAARKGFDVVGVLAISGTAGLGGLLLRDILLQQGTPVILTEPAYLLTAIAMAVVGFFFAGLLSRFDAPMVILDGLAMGFLCTVGADAALGVGLKPTSAILIGIITAVGGQVLRDVVAGAAPQLVRPGVFVAIPALVSSSIFVFLVQSQIPVPAAQVAAMIVALGLRVSAKWLGWHTGSAADLSDRVWNYWYRARRKPAASDPQFTGQHRVSSPDSNSSSSSSSSSTSGTGTQ